jgi:hypothetical protein
MCVYQCMKPFFFGIGAVKCIRWISLDYIMKSIPPFQNISLFRKLNWAITKMSTSTRNKWMERCSKKTRNDAIHLCYKISFRYIKLLKMGGHTSNFEMILSSICGDSWCSVVCLSCMNYVVSSTFVTSICYFSFREIVLKYACLNYCSVKQKVNIEYTTTSIP